MAVFMKKHLVIDGRTYYSFEEPLFVGPKLVAGMEGNARVPASVHKPGSGEIKPKRRIFDWTFGVVMPVLCFLLDPFVFRTYGHGDGEFAAVAPFAYVLSFVAIMALMAWLIWGAKLQGLLPFISGLSAVAALVSGFIGLVLFPFSLLGLSFGVWIAALGLTPIISSIVFLKAAIHTSPEASDPATSWHSFALGAIASFTLPILVNQIWR
jgi:hypothetical protein